MAADSGMETCPSPEAADSRKRPLDGEAENGDNKRSHFSSDGGSDEDRPVTGGDGTFHFKLLVPSVAAGAIIGKGGETIAQLQKETGARVKMSKSHDFYPGTTERVCLITGSVEAIINVLNFIIEKIREKPDLTKAGDTESKMHERDRQVKILVPNSTAGMIIGKAGNYIKQIKESSGSYVQISQKAKDVSLQERCITVIGDKEQNKQACLMIIINELQLRNTGYGDNQIVEICAALSVLAKYGIISVGLGIGSTHPGALPVSNYLSVMDQTGATNASTGVFGAIGQVSLGECLGANSATPRTNLERYDSAFDPFRHQMSAATAPISLNNNSFGLGTGQQMAVLSKSPTPAELGSSKDTKNVEIAEVIVGAILGPGGRSLVEIQQISGANIQISKKGIFAPGTRNRIVTITGNPQAITTAHYLIEQRISEEEMKRARNNGLGTLAMQ
nr:RNA-binding protein Nova-1 [Leptinotarsa decemlineata]